MKKSVLLMLVAIFNSCTSNGQVESKFNAVFLNSKAEVFLSLEKKIETLSRSIEIVNSNKYQLFLMSEIRTNSELYPDSLGRARAKLGMHNVTDTVDVVFIYDKINKLMAKYSIKSFDKEKGRLLKNVEPILEMFTIGVKTRTVIEQDLGTPDKVVDNKGEVVEKFALKNGKELTTDSVYYFYNQKMSPIDFSLSDKLDSKHNSKLFKVLFIYSSNSKSDLNSKPRRETFFELKESKEKKDKLLNAIINKFEKDKALGFK